MLAAPLFKHLGPAPFRRLLCNILPSKRIQRLRDTIEVMETTSKEILEANKHGQIQENGSRDASYNSTSIIHVLCKRPSPFQPPIPRVTSYFVVKWGTASSQESTMSDAALVGQMKYVDKPFLLTTVP